MPRIPVRILTHTPEGSANPASSVGRSTAAPNLQTTGQALPRLQYPTFSQNRRQQAVQQITAPVRARNDADQNVVAGVAIAGGSLHVVGSSVVFAAPTAPTVVRHGLGRAFVGAYAQNATGAPVAVYIVPNADPRLNASQVQIAALFACTADVVVY